MQNQFAEARVFEPEVVAVDMDCEAAVPDRGRRFADSDQRGGGSTY